MSRVEAAIFVLGAAVAVVALALVFLRKPNALPLLAVAAVPFRLPISVGDKSANLLVPLYIVIGAGLLAYLVRWWRSGHSLTYSNRSTVGIVLGASVALYAAQALYSDDLSKGLENVVFFYIPFLALFFLLREVTWDRKLAVRCLMIATALALVFVGIGFYEFATKHLLLNPKVISSNQFESYFRVNSLFFDPNIYGRFLAIVMIGAAAVLLWTERSRTIVWSALVLAVLLAGLVLTFSQSSFIALLIGLATLGALKVSFKVAASVAGVLVAIAVVIVVGFPQLVNLDYSSERSVDKATSGRFELVSGGVDLFIARPIIGYGSGSFAREYRVQNKASSERASSASHTIPITVAAEQGAVGLLLYLALLAAAFWTLFRSARGDPVRAAIAAAFLALVVHTLMYAAFLEDPLTWVLLAAGVVLSQFATRGAHDSA